MSWGSELVAYLRDVPARFAISEMEAAVFWDDPKLCVVAEGLVAAGIEPHKAATWLLNHPDQRHIGVPALLEQINHKPFDDLSADVIETACREIISGNAELTEKFRAGKRQVLGKLIGAVRAKLPKAAPNTIKDTLERLLEAA